MKISQLFFVSLFPLLILSGCTTDKSNNTHEENNSSTALVMVEEFSDIECPFCKRIHPIIAKLQSDFTNVDFQYRYFPLEQIHPHAFGAAAATECIKQEKGNDTFKKYLTDLYDTENLEIENLITIASKHEVNTEQFESCIKSRDISKTIRADIREGISRGVQGTPTLFINGEKVSSQDMSYDKLYAKIAVLINTQESTNENL